jgi:hypothetical protein
MSPVDQSHKSCCTLATTTPRLQLDTPATRAAVHDTPASPGHLAACTANTQQHEQLVSHCFVSVECKRCQRIQVAPAAAEAAAAVAAATAA